MQGREDALAGSDVQLTGLFIAQVVKNADPKACERVFVRIIGVHDMKNEDEEYGCWVNHCAPSKSASGDIPDIDDWVYVMFLDKQDPMSGVYIGWVRTKA